MNEWVPFAFEKPEAGRLVLVWRSKRERYCIARYERMKANPTDPENEPEHDAWITEQSNCHEVEPDDCWLAFTPFKHEKVYD